MPRSLSVHRAVAAALLLAPVLAGCSSSHSVASAPAGSDAPVVATGAAVTGAASPSPSPSAASAPAYPTTEAAPGAAPMQVRDAFAVLQATYNDSCGTPGNCSYFLGRVLQNLDDLDNAMKASSEGRAHFGQPLAWISGMQTSLHGDFSFANLKSHQSLLIATRNKINTWMQSHPEDYR